MSIQTRFFPALISELLDDEQQPTHTSREQRAVELSIRKCYDRFEQLVALDPNLPVLYRTEHLRYIEAALRQLSAGYECLDSSRPWLVYWILQSAALLGHRFDELLLDQVVSFLVCCRSEGGGFAGGPGQQPHLAPTYAAINALCLIGTERALHAISRRTLKEFLHEVRQPDGSFLMHVGGESDIRGVYCAVAVAKLAHFSQPDMREMFAGTVEWIASCQTYEGGIGGAPDLEAHGGYTFCGVAALALLGTNGGCDLRALMRWSINRQMRYEGGFQGRSNKLVDGCYSFWQGAVMPIVQALIYGEVQQAAKAEKAAQAREKMETHYKSYLKEPLFHRGALQEYVLICCQRPFGGLVDKPGKPQDLYHTCYTLSGLAIAQHCELDLYPLVIGVPDNELSATHPLYNIPARSVWRAAEHFRQHNYDLYADSETEAPTETDTTSVSAADSDGASGGAARVAATHDLWPDSATSASSGKQNGGAQQNGGNGRKAASATSGRSSSVATTTASGTTGEEVEEEVEEEETEEETGSGDTESRASN